MVRLSLHSQIKARHVTPGAIVMAAIAIAVSLWLLVLPPDELKAQANSAPTIYSYSTPNSVTTGNRVTFQSTATDADGNITKWGWYLDDVLQGEYTFNPQRRDTRVISHTFATAGDYTLKSTFTDSGGLSVSHTWDVEVTEPNRPPSVARVTPSASTVTLNVGERQTFSARATDSDANISEWDWFLDGVSQNGQSLALTGDITRTFTHTFPTAGTYTVEAEFTDLDGESDSVTWRVVVPPTPQHSYDGATRSFNPERVAPGGSVTVTIQVGQAFSITETLPDGFTYTGSSIDDPADDNDFLTVGQTVTFTPFGERSFTYTVTASRTAGSHRFSGVARFDSDRDNDLPVGGASTVTVEAVIDGDPLVARYDANNNGTIERSEVIAAINDYLFGGVISRRDVIRLINLYLFGPSTPHNRPGAPEGLTAAGNGQTRIDLSWSAPASDGGAAITGYRIEVSENGATWTDLVANTRNAATSYSHTGLTAGSTRHYRVSAINSAGTGPASNIATGTTATGTTVGDAATDRAALVALYNATDGANWRNNGNWLSNAPMGEWHRVTTDSDGRVTQLVLYDNQLTGDMPAELGSLTNLEFLSLYDNQLTGEIPAELDSLTNLQTLDLADNQLTGEIPAELGSLTNLTHLFLYSNQLTGEIPAELGNLINLEVLYLDSNQLTGEIPAELGNLINLESLYLTNNQLVGCIPEELRNVPYNDLDQLGLDYCSGDQAPDLVASVTSVISVGDGGPLYVGESFTINAEVYNQGTGPAASTTLRYYHSTDSTISTSDTLVGTNPVRSLEVSGSSPESIGRTAPSSTGTYYYGACVDSVAGESNTRNNCSGGYGTEVLQRTSPDLVASVTSVGDAGILYAGEPFTINAVVHNQGTGPAASTNLRYYRSTDRTISTSDTLVGTNPVRSLEVSGSSPESIGRTAPSSTGTYYYGACVDSVAGESNTRNNCSGGYGTEVLQRTSPDLVASVTSVGDAGILYAGEPFTINAVVHNQGTGPAASTNLRYYRSTDRTISTSDTLVGTNPVRSLEVSGSSPESIGRTAPSSTGTYYYGACVDSVAGESNTRNNCSGGYGTEVLQRTSPDLVASVTSVGDAGILYAGEPFTINAVVHNQGTGPAASTNLRYYRSTDRTISTSDTLVGTNPVRSLEVSGSSPESIGRTAPSSTGTYYYGACVDSVAGESNTRNNCSGGYGTEVLQRTSPDLVAWVTSVGDGGLLYAGGPFTINAEVHNQGTGPAASTNLRYYRSTDRTISTSDTLVGTNPVRSLEVSGSSPESISRTAPSSAGTYYYGVCVDSVAGESNTRNNCSEGFRTFVLEPAFVSTIECRATLLGVRYTIEGTVYAITALSNVTVIGYGIDNFGLRTKVGEDDLGTMSAQTSESFSISGFNRLYTSCEYSLEWEY